MKRVKRDTENEIFLDHVQWDEIGNNLAVAEPVSDGHVTGRMIFGVVFIVLIFGYLFTGIIKLQIIEGKKYLNASSQNYLVERPITNNRGIIYDINGIKLVENVASHRLFMRTYGVTKSGEERMKGEIEKLLVYIPLEFDEVWQIYLDNKENDKISEVVVYGNIDYSTYLRLKVMEDELEFFSVDENSARNYLAGNGFSHILGYTGEVTSLEMTKEVKYKYGDIIGKED